MSSKGGWSTGLHGSWLWQSQLASINLRPSSGVSSRFGDKPAADRQLTQQVISRSELPLADWTFSGTELTPSFCGPFGRRSEDTVTRHLFTWDIEGTESDYTGKGGVSPQIRIPRTYDTMLAVGQGQDVELKAAERELAKMLSSGPSFRPAR